MAETDGMTWYRGRRSGHTAFVYGPGMVPLDMGLAWVRKSPAGPEWGYNGSGPHQLAFALLWDVLMRDKTVRAYGRRASREAALRAVPLMHSLTVHLVCCLPREWDMAAACVLSFLPLALAEERGEPVAWQAWRDALRSDGLLIEKAREDE